MGTENKHFEKAISLEAFIFFGVFIVIFEFLASKMGGVNIMNTLMDTAY